MQSEMVPEAVLGQSAFVSESEWNDGRWHLIKDEFKVVNECRVFGESPEIILP